MAPNVSAVPTPTAGETPNSRISSGVVRLPAPTPVSEMARAIANPSKTSTLAGPRDMDSALELASCPAAGARIGEIGWLSRARLTTDAGIAKLIERQQGDVMEPGE